MISRWHEKMTWIKKNFPEMKERLHLKLIEFWLSLTYLSTLTISISYIFFLIQECSKQESNVERNLQLYHSTISILWEKQKRLAELHSTQFESKRVFHKNSTWRRWRTKRELLDIRFENNFFNTLDFNIDSFSDPQYDDMVIKT